MVEDAEGRVIDRLRLSVTDRCDQRCTYCMPECGVQKIAHSEVLTIEEMTLVASALVEHAGIRGIRLTGGEPLLRAGLLDLVAELSGLGLDDLAMTTNAQTLERMATALADRGLDRVNVSLDSLDPRGYERITRGGSLERAQAGIRAARDAGLTPLKTNTVVLRGINEDQVVPLVRWGLEEGVEVRFLELMPIGVAREIHETLFVPTADVVERVAAELDLSPDPVGHSSTARLHEVTDGQGRTGRVGFISPETEPFCDRCRRLRLTTTGTLLTCLHMERGVELKPVLRAEGGADVEVLVETIRRAIKEKPSCRPGSRRSSMSTVGG